MPDQEEQQIINRLKAYQKQMDDLLELLKSLPMKGSHRSEAQQMLKALKDGLRSDYQRGNSQRGREQMTQAGLQYFHPAVHGALSRIRVRWNSVPAEDWFDQVYDARIDITHMLDQLGN